ncbi:UDP-3-0-acyl N-acetylglucosamine deacetylase family protein, expressed [Panicum miliaceum]|uniref:UDP-3-0-acyl N-acetylglucosamine deacetylase family protein, expressed n=1 Tax=Panicum miliaceum TaxID=4540 RepID=A0A3L6SC67_PANMI|nr:UDP-3-0-acyl N-acetylglucosamine deacetylase family protein, expressed [Panicum miliaceum]
MSSAAARALKSVSRAAFSWKPTANANTDGKDWYFLVDGVGGGGGRGKRWWQPRRRGPRIRTVEHLLSAMEALDVDNSHVEVSGGERDDCFAVVFPSSQIHITYGIDFLKFGLVWTRFWSDKKLGPLARLFARRNIHGDGLGWQSDKAYSRCSPAGARAPRLRSVQLMIVDVGGTVDGFREPTGYCALP